MMKATKLTKILLFGICYKKRSKLIIVEAKALLSGAIVSFIIAINRFVIIVNFHNRFDKALTEIFQFLMALVEANRKDYRTSEARGPGRSPKVKNEKKAP